MLTQVAFRNFRLLEQVSIALGRVTVITGPAGEGKTSHIEGIRLGLTGTNAWTDERGAGAQSQVTLGAKKALVDLTWADPGTGQIHKWSREIPGKGVKALQTQIDEVLGVPSTVVSAQLASRRILEMEPKPAQDMLQQLLLPPMTFDMLELEMEKLKKGLGKWAGPRLEKAPDNQPLLAWASMERLSAKKARDLSANDLRSLETQTEPAQVSQEQLETLRQKRDELVAEIAEAQAGRSQARDVYRAEHESWETRRRERSALTAALNHQQTLVLAGETKVSHMPPASDTGRISAQEQAVTQQEELLRKLDAEMAEITGRMGAAQDGTGACPPGKCARAQLEQASAEMRRVSDALTRARDSEKLARQALEALKSQTLARQTAEAELAAVRKRVAEIKQQLEALPAQGSEPQAPAQQYDDEAALCRKADLEKRLREAEAATAARAAWSKHLEQVEALRKRLAEQEADVLRWEATYAALGPTGIKAKLLEKRLVEFAGQVDGLLSQYFGARFRVVPDPWEMQVDRGRGWLPAAQESWSWQARVSACLQIALARASGFPLVAVDETGGDPLVRSDLLALFTDQEDVQAIILSTAQTVNDVGEFVRPRVDPEDTELGVSWFWVEGGQIVELQPQNEMAEV